MNSKRSVITHSMTVYFDIFCKKKEKKVLFAKITHLTFDICAADTET